MTSLFGFDRKDVVLNSNWWEEQIHDDDRDRVTSRVRQFIKDKIESWQDEYRFICADGSIKWVFDRGYILFDDSHIPYRMIGAMMDITERKKLQDELANQVIARQKLVTEATLMAQEKERAETLHKELIEAVASNDESLEIQLIGELQGIAL